MDKKEYNRIMINLINKRFDKIDIQNIKKKIKFKRNIKIFIRNV